METELEHLKQGEQLCTKQCGSDHKYERNSDKGRSECTGLACQAKICLTFWVSGLSNIEQQVEEKGHGKGSGVKVDAVAKAQTNDRDIE